MTTNLPVNHGISAAPEGTIHVDASAPQEQAEGVITDVRELLRTKYEAFKERTGITTYDEAGKHIGVDGDKTLSRHMRVEFGFASRTWTRIADELQITQEEIDQLTNFDFEGIKSDERKRIIEVVNVIIAEDPNVFDEQILSSLSLTNPEMLGHTPSELFSVFSEVRKSNGIEDPRRPLLQEIDGLGKRISSLSRRESEERIRNFEIGNMFEQVALLDYQMGDRKFVPEYCLTATRDEMGKVRHTTDIIDLVIQDPAQDNVTEKAYYDLHAAKTPGSETYKVDDGTITVVTDGDITYHRYCPNGDESQAVPLGKIRDGGLHEATDNGGVAARYSIHGKSRILYDLSSRALKLGALTSLLGSQDLEEGTECWDNNQPYIGVEIKKAGSANVERIVKQLRRQRDGILRHREEHPESIPGMVHHINVVVLNPNKALKEAIAKLNEEHPFFNYVEFKGIGDTFTRAHERLQHRTLAETQVLKRFFKRINEELAKQPTLRPLAEQNYESTSDMMNYRFLHSDDHDETRMFIDDLLERQDDRAREREAENAQSEKVQQAKDLLLEFEQHLGSTTRNKDDDANLSSVLEGELATLFEKHFEVPFKHPKDEGTRMIVHEERDGELLAYPRKFQLRGTSSIGGVDLLERAKTIAKKNGYDVDFEDLEAVQDFIDHLTQELEGRKERQQMIEALESAFSVRSIECHVAQYDAERDERFGERLRLYTPLESGVITAIRKNLANEQIDQGKADTQEILIASRLQQARADRKGSEINQSIVSTAELAFKQRQEESPCLYTSGTEMEQALMPFFQGLHQQLATCSADEIGPLLSGGKRAISTIGTDYKEVLEASWSTATLQSAFARFATRPSLEINITSRLETALKNVPMTEEDKQLAFDQSQDLVSSLGTEIDANNPSLEILSKLIPNLHKPSSTDVSEKANSKQMLELMNALGVEIANVIRSNQMNVDAATLTKLSMAEQRIMYEFGLRTLEQAVSLHEASPHLASDYVLSNIRGFVQHADVFSDLYLDKYLRINEALKGTNPKEITEYLAFVAQKEGETDPHALQGEFLRRLVVLSLQEHQPIPQNNPPLAHGVERTFALIANGEESFDDAYALYCQSNTATDAVLGSIYSRETSDPHLRSMRRRQLHQHKEEELESEDNSRTTAGEIFNKGLQAKALVDIRAEDSIKLWSETKERDEPETRAHMLTLLRNFAHVSKKMAQSHPEIALDEHSMRKIETYRGFRCYDQAARAIDYILDRAPEFWNMYYYDPGDVLAYARYLDPNSDACMRDDRQRRRKQIKKRQQGKGSKKARREKAPIPTVELTVADENRVLDGAIAEIDVILNGEKSSDELA
ncbi:MAG: hypothetical protein QF793_01710 [Candidatus Peribacteraceae bacterium]|nr:hypothetical protein [Candidatus Peribacteraceae bacterium]